MTSGSHPIKACNVHIGENKDKMLFILYSSKTHGRELRSQKIKITASAEERHKTFFCPFEISREYFALRGNYGDPDDPFFVFRNQQPVRPSHVWNVLKKTLQAINLPSSMYGFHSVHIGRATDMIKFGNSISEVHLAGRWRMNVVYKYIRSTQ